MYYLLRSSYLEYVLFTYLEYVLFSCLEYVRVRRENEFSGKASLLPNQASWFLDIW